MENAKTFPTKIMLDLEKLNTLNADKCPACGGSFSLGETLVLACGAWGDHQKYIHESEAVYDPGALSWFERKHHRAAKERC